MPTKAQMKKELRESLDHWNENLRMCPRIGSKRWFEENCQGTKCALCCRVGCGSCPLNDLGGACCKQWRLLQIRAINNKPIKRNVRAVRDRVAREYVKVGGKI